MSICWNRTPWRRLYCHLPNSTNVPVYRRGNNWEQLPLFARALADELTTICDDTGSIVLADNTDPVGALCRLLGAHRTERKQVRRLIQKLEDVGHIAWIDSDIGKCLVITNFEEEQITCRRGYSVPKSSLPPESKKSGDETHARLDFDVSMRNPSVEVGQNSTSEDDFPGSTHARLDIDVSARNHSGGVGHNGSCQTNVPLGFDIDVSARNHSVGVGQHGTHDVVATSDDGVRFDFDVSQRNHSGRKERSFLERDSTDTYTRFHYDVSARNHSGAFAREEKSIVNNTTYCQQTSIPGVEAPNGKEAARVVRQHWCDTFLHKKGEVAPWVAGEGVAVKTLLSKFQQNPERVCEVITNAFEDTWFVNKCADIKNLAKNPAPYVKRKRNLRSVQPSPQSTPMGLFTSNSLSKGRK